MGRRTIFHNSLVQVVTNLSYLTNGYHGSPARMLLMCWFNYTVSSITTQRFLALETFSISEEQTVTCDIRTVKDKTKQKQDKKQKQKTKQNKTKQKQSKTNLEELWMTSGFSAFRSSLFLTAHARSGQSAGMGSKHCSWEMATKIEEIMTLVQMGYEEKFPAWTLLLRKKTLCPSLDHALMYSSNWTYL